MAKAKKRSAEAVARRAERKVQRVADKVRQNGFARLEQSMFGTGGTGGTGTGGDGAVSSVNRLAQTEEILWKCLHEGCGNENYPRRRVCNRCGAPNPNPIQRPQQVKQPRPTKKPKVSNWKENATAEERAENIRLRDLLEKEIRTGEMCVELADDEEKRERATWCYNRMLEKQTQKTKKSKRKGKGDKSLQAE
jgi:hypothetical protein